MSSKSDYCNLQKDIETIYKEVYKQPQSERPANSILKVATLYVKLKTNNENAYY